MQAIVKGNFMEQGKGYDKKDKVTKEVIGHVDEILVYSGGQTIKISGINGQNFQKFEEIEILCNITTGTYGLNVSVVI